MAITPDMNAVLRSRFEQLAGEYERLDAHLSEARERLRELRGAASSADGGIKVTVGPRGALVGLEVEPRTYRRLSPSELTTAILDLSAKAVDDALAQAEEIMTPFLPPELPFRAVVNGTANLNALRGRPLGPEAFERLLARMTAPTTDEPTDEPRDERQPWN